MVISSSSRTPWIWLQSKAITPACGIAGRAVLSSWCEENALDRGTDYETGMAKPIMNLDEIEFDDVEENGVYTSSLMQATPERPHSVSM